MRRILACLSVLLLIIFLFDSAHAGEVLTNVSVMQMHEAGLGESLIIKKIKTSGGRFDISTNGIIALKKAGIPEKIIEAMMAGGQERESAEPVASASGTKSSASKAGGPSLKGAAKLPESGDFFLFQNGKYVEIESHVGTAKISMAKLIFTAGFAGDGWLTVEGIKAPFRVPASQKTLTFVSRIRPVETAPLQEGAGDLLKMSAKKDIRYAVASGSVVSGGALTPKKEFKIGYEAKKQSNGTYIITTKEPLGAGEYAFVFLGKFPDARVFDFAID